MYTQDTPALDWSFLTEIACGCRRTVQQAVEAIRTAAASNKREGDDIIAWLKEQQA